MPPNSGWSAFRYYTNWSNAFFYLCLIWLCVGKVSPGLAPPLWLINAAMANIIAVGVIGNLIMAINGGNIFRGIQKDYPDLTNDQIYSTLSTANLIFHTFPLMIAILTVFSVDLPAVTGTVEENPRGIFYSLAFLIMFAIAWNATPFNGKVFWNKINTVYADPPAWLFGLLPVIWIGALFAIQKINNSKLS